MHDEPGVGEARAAAGLATALVRMQRIEAEPAPNDGVLWFNRLYREVTEEVVRRLQAGTFEDAEFLEHLAVAFGEAYFAAIDAFAPGAGGRGSRAWKPLFDARFDRRVAPIQFALAGMNAHINFDLAVSVRDTCAALGHEPREGTAQHRDYLRLNEVLGEMQERVKRWLVPGLLGRVDRVLGRLDDVVASFSVARARDAAWVHGRTLWALRDDASLTAAHLGTLERIVGLAGRGLVVPTLLGLARWAGAQAWLPPPARALLGAPCDRLPRRG